MSSNVRFPLQPASSPVKRGLHRLLGTIAKIFMPQRAAALADPTQTLSLTRSDYWMLQSMVAHDARHAVLGRFDHLHLQFWGGSDAANFQIAEGQRRFQRFLDSHATTMLPAVQSALAHTPCTRWLEIGTGTGEVLNFWAQQLPNFTRFDGIEYNPTLAAYSQSRATDARIQIVAGDGMQLVRTIALGPTVFWTYGGVLEYFSTAVIADYFAWIAQRTEPSILALIEPIGADHQLGSGPLSQAYGSESTHSHDYARLATQAGLRVRYQFETITGKQRWTLLLADAT